MLQAGKPLKGIKVLDLTQALSGPFATQLMVDQGADVVKVESPAHPDNTRGVHPFIGETSHYFLAINHGKRSLGLDLKQPEGRDLLLRLAEKADVIISNYRVGTLDKLGLDSATLQQRNPRLIQCLVSGFGQADSMYRTKAVYDANIQALTGFMSITCEPEGGPLRCGVSIGDIIPGLFALQAVTAALLQRKETGKGQVIDVAMYDCMVSALSYYVTLTQATGTPPAPSGAMHASVAPMGRFQTHDGWLMVTAFTEEFWRKLCRALGCPEFIDDARFVTMKERLQNRDELMRELHARFIQKTCDEWIAILDEYDVPNSPVLNVLDVLNHPVTRQRQLLQPQTTVDGRKVEVSRQPVVFGMELPPVRTVPRSPLLGEHSDDVLRDWLGEGESGIDSLRRAKAVF